MTATLSPAEKKAVIRLRELRKASIDEDFAIGWKVGIDFALNEATFVQLELLFGYQNRLGNELVQELLEKKFNNLAKMIFSDYHDFTAFSRAMEDKYGWQINSSMFQFGFISAAAYEYSRLFPEICPL